jgi:hypothetical protein
MAWTLVAAYGLWVALHRHRDLGLLLLATWIGYPMVHYLVQGNTRYRDPIEWSVTLLAIYVLTVPLVSQGSVNPAALARGSLQRRVSALGETPLPPMRCSTDLVGTNRTFRRLTASRIPSAAFLSDFTRLVGLLPAAIAPMLGENATSSRQ